MRSLYAALLTLCAAVIWIPSGLRAAPERMQIGAKPDNFTLTAIDGQSQSLKVDPAPPATVVIFIATQCPVSNACNERMASLGADCQAKGARFMAVNSNKQEAMSEVTEHARKHNFSFIVVKDPDNKIADRWGALVTPEAFVLDKEGELQYHGRVDDSQDPSGVKSHDLKVALDAVLAGRKPERQETRAFGCTIKRKD